MFSSIVSLLLNVIFVYCTICLVKYCHKQYKLYLELRHFPGPPIVNPFTGHLYLFVQIILRNHISNYGRELNKLMHSLCDTYGGNDGYVRLWFGPFMPWVIFCEERHIKTILTDPNYLAKARYYEGFRIFAGQELFTMSGKNSIDERRRFEKFFKIPELNFFIPQIETQLAHLNERIESCLERHSGLCTDAEPLVSNFVFDTTGVNLFSTKFNSQVNGQESSFVEAKKHLMELISLLVLSPWNYFLSFPKNPLQLLFLIPFTLFGVKTLFNAQIFLRKVVQDRMKLVEKSSKKQTLANISKANESLMQPHGTKSAMSMIDSMIVAKAFKEPNRIENIYANSSLFLLAGHDTSTSTISWTLYMLAHHQVAQEKCAAEVDAYVRQLDATDRAMNATNLKKLKYVECCILEALRLVPAAATIGRRGIAPLKLNHSHTLPADVNVILFTQRMQSSEKYFHNAKHFVPERFLAQADEATAKPAVQTAATLPFGFGPQSCPAKNYALMQMKIFLINMLHYYKFKALDKYGEAQPAYTILETPAHFPLLFERR